MNKHPSRTTQIRCATDTMMQNAVQAWNAVAPEDERLTDLGKRALAAGIQAALAHPPAAERETCSLGAGCDEMDMCYARQFDRPDQCGRSTEREAPGGVPEGWTIIGDDETGFVHIMDPTGCRLAIGYAAGASSDASRMLRDLAVAMLAAAPSLTANTGADSPELQAAYERGVRDSATILEKKAQDYHWEHGNQEWDTGAWNYPGDGAEWMEDWENSRDAILALLAAPAEGGGDA